MSAFPPLAPGVSLWTFFKGRGEPIVLGSTGAEDLVPLVPLVEPVSAGRPPVMPMLVSSIEVPIGAASVQGGSGWRRTAPAPGVGVGLWGGRVVIDVEWPILEQDQLDVLLAYLQDEVGLGGKGGTLRAMTIDVDGEDNTGSAVEVRAIEVPEDVMELVERVCGRVGIYRVGPLRCEEVL